MTKSKDEIIKELKQTIRRLKDRADFRETMSRRERLEESNFISNILHELRIEIIRNNDREYTIEKLKEEIKELKKKPKSKKSKK